MFRSAISLTGILIFAFILFGCRNANKNHSQPAGSSKIKDHSNLEENAFDRFLFNNLLEGQQIDPQSASFHQKLHGQELLISLNDEASLPEHLRQKESGIYAVKNAKPVSDTADTSWRKDLKRIYIYLGKLKNYKDKVYLVKIDESRLVTEQATFGLEGRQLNGFLSAEGTEFPGESEPAPQAEVDPLDPFSPQYDPSMLDEEITELEDDAVEDLPGEYETLPSESISADDSAVDDAENLPSETVAANEDGSGSSSGNQEDFTEDMSCGTYWVEFEETREYFGACIENEGDIFTTGGGQECEVLSQQEEEYYNTSEYNDIKCIQELRCIVDHGVAAGNTGTSPGRSYNVACLGD